VWASSLIQNFTFPATVVSARVDRHSTPRIPTLGATVLRDLRRRCSYSGLESSASKLSAPLSGRLEEPLDADARGGDLLLTLTRLGARQGERDGHMTCRNAATSSQVVAAFGGIWFSTYDGQARIGSGTQSGRICSANSAFDAGGTSGIFGRRGNYFGIETEAPQIVGHSVAGNHGAASSRCRGAADKRFGC